MVHGPLVASIQIPNFLVVAPAIKRARAASTRTFFRLWGRCFRSNSGEDDFSIACVTITIKRRMSST